MTEDEDKIYLDNMVAKRDMQGIKKEFVKRGLIKEEIDHENKVIAYTITKFAGVFLAFIEALQICWQNDENK